MDGEVTYDEVWAAANSLKSEGAQVNTATVRHRLGDIGHFEVIHQALELWRAGSKS
ncbi:DNA-binding protein [Luteimonas flava]|uniref:DNA-binding protein n=1 Tax=Luteimonas flava TaxID=3115822 RepID=UPI003CCE526D